MPFLVVSLGGQEIERHELSGPTVVGRSVDADISVRDASLSRWHCRFEPCPPPANVSSAAAMWSVTDLGSRNGTNLNGRRIQTHTLHHGDLLRIGRCTLFFSTDDFVPLPELPPGPKSTGAPVAVQVSRAPHPLPRERVAADAEKLASDGSLMTGANVQRFPKPLLVPADRLPRPAPDRKPKTSRPSASDLELMSSPGWSRHLGKAHPTPPSPSVDHRPGEKDSSDTSAATLDLQTPRTPASPLSKLRSFFSHLLRR